MCAILGMIGLPGCTVETFEARSIFGELLVAGMTRGTDATGLAWSEKLDGVDIIQVHKAPMPASQFVSERIHRVWPSDTPEIVIGHTRASTKGSESNNSNNHPVFDARAGIAVVHNGCIRNDDALFAKYQMERDAEVDSEVIPKLIGRHYFDGEAGIRGDIDRAIAKTAEELSGSFAFLVISAYHPGKLWLAKNVNPAYVCLSPDRRMILIGSVDQYFDRALGIGRTWLGFFEAWESEGRQAVTEVGSNSIVRIDRLCEPEDEIISASEFKPSAEDRTSGVSHDWRSWGIYSRYGYDDEWLCLDEEADTLGGQSAQTPPKDRRLAEIFEPRQTVQGSGGDCIWRVGNVCMNTGLDGRSFPCYMTGSIYGGAYRPDMCPSLVGEE